MRTVKEISDLTGISVRTLHYYDEIGLLKPTEKSDAGYRLYDDKALETLQQILFFREFDISLKEIKAVLDNPALERNQILQVQRKMLVTKKERILTLPTARTVATVWQRMPRSRCRSTTLVKRDRPAHVAPGAEQSLTATTISSRHSAEERTSRSATAAERRKH